MDTSEQYIRMRIAAIPDMGMGDSNLALSSLYFVTDNVWVAPNGNYYFKSSGVIGCQLERQDQLQEMVGGHGWAGELTKLDRWIQEIPFSQLHPLDTWEQLWLGFVMREKFNKIWTGTEWI